MNARPEISKKNIFSIISSLASSGSKSYAVDCSSRYGGHHSKYADRRASISEMELSHVAADKGDDHHENGDHFEGRKYGFRMVYVCAMAAMFSALCSGYSSLYAGPATYDMQTRRSSRIKVTDEETSWIGSTVTIGMGASVPLAVYMADRIGRKDTLIANCIPFTISWLIIIYANSVSAIMVGRFLGGWASAVVYVVLPMYAVEISSADTRGLIGASFQASVAIGSLLVMGLGAFLVWSWLAVAGLVGVVVTLIVFCPMPESPRWLVANGRKENAIHAIQFLHADKLDAAKECQIIEDNLKEQKESKFSFENLRQPIVYKPALISMGQMVFVQFSGSTAILLFSSFIFEGAKSSVEPKYSTLILGATQVIATVLSSLIMDKAGRRVLLLGSGFLMGISLATLGAYFYACTYDDTLSEKAGWLPLATLVSYVAVFSMGFGPIPWLMLSEMVPTRERGFVSGVATLLVSILAFIATKTFENLKTLINFHGVFWTYSAFCFLSCAFVYFLVPETKGKQLEEIQSIFSGVRRRAADGNDEMNSPASGIDNPGFQRT